MISDEVKDDTVFKCFYSKNGVSKIYSDCNAYGKTTEIICHNSNDVTDMVKGTLEDLFSITNSHLSQPIANDLHQKLRRYFHK
jgi:hypothetical protein